MHCIVLYGVRSLSPGPSLDYSLQTSVCLMCLNVWKWWGVRTLPMSKNKQQVVFRIQSQTRFTYDRADEDYLFCNSKFN